MNETLQSPDDRIYLYSDLSLCDPETPLTGFGTEDPNEAVLVSVSVIKTYRQIIRRLELQVFQYKTLLRQLAPASRPVEEFAAQPSKPLNDASIEVVNSILESRISNESILRAFDDEDA